MPYLQESISDFWRADVRAMSLQPLQTSALGAADKCTRLELKGTWAGHLKDSPGWMETLCEDAVRWCPFSCPPKAVQVFPKAEPLQPTPCQQTALQPSLQGPAHLPKAVTVTHLWPQASLGTSERLPKDSQWVITNPILKLLHISVNILGQTGLQHGFWSSVPINAPVLVIPVPAIREQEQPQQLWILPLSQPFTPSSPAPHCRDQQSWAHRDLCKQLLCCCTGGWSCVLHMVTLRARRISYSCFSWHLEGQPGFRIRSAQYLTSL